MSKSSFTTIELNIWRSIYGVSRGPTQGRLKILVEEFESRGLAPVMMRVGDDMGIYDAARFQVAIREACQNKDDDGVQVYYHPQDCERVVGSSATTWTQWGRLILNIEGLVPANADDNHPVILENVPRLRLPTDVRALLGRRGVTTSSVCRLMSARVTAFFIAAQYEAWATPAQVGQVAPFKKTLQKQGFQIREVIVRRDAGMEDVFRELPPAVQQPSPAPAVKNDSELMAGISELESPVTPSIVISCSDICQPVEGGFPEEIGDDIDAEIARVQAQLRVLQQCKEVARAKAARQAYLSATVSDVVLDQAHRPTEIRLQFQDGTSLRLRVHMRLDDLLADIA